MTEVFRRLSRRGGVINWAIITAAALLAAAVMAVTASAAQAQGSTPTPQNSQTEVPPTPASSPPTEAPVIITHWVSNQSLVLRWQGVDDDSITGQEIQSRPSKGSEWLPSRIVEVGPLTIAFAYMYTSGLSRGALPPGVEHDFRIRAVNPAGAGPWSNVYKAGTSGSTPEPTTPEPTEGNSGQGGESTPVPANTPMPKKNRPLKVRHLTVTPAEGTTATVSWTRSWAGNKERRCSPANPQQYRYKVVLWDPGVKVKDLTVVIDFTNTSNKTVSLSGLVPGTEYAVLVFSRSDECNNWSKFRRVIWTQPGGEGG